MSISHLILIIIAAITRGSSHGVDLIFLQLKNRIKLRCCRTAPWERRECKWVAYFTVLVFALFYQGGDRRESEVLGRGYR
jgi:hypothetical protein